MNGKNHLRAALLRMAEDIRLPFAGLSREHRLDASALRRVMQIAGRDDKACHEAGLYNEASDARAVVKWCDNMILEIVSQPAASPVTKQEA
jgi:hypothetical protein